MVGEEDTLLSIMELRMGNLNRMIENIKIELLKYPQNSHIKWFSGPYSKYFNNKYID